MAKRKRATYAEAVVRLNAKKLFAYDFSATDAVLVIHEDGTTLLFRWAICQEFNGWLLVWTEHNGYHAFSQDDLTVWQRLRLNP